MFSVTAVRRIGDGSITSICNNSWAICAKHLVQVRSTYIFEFILYVILSLLSGFAETVENTFPRGRLSEREYRSILVFISTPPYTLSNDFRTRITYRTRTPCFVFELSIEKRYYYLLKLRKNDVPITAVDSLPENSTTN